MPPTAAAHGHRHYLVELRRPREGWSVAEVTGRARSAAVTTDLSGVDVQFVRSVYAPESDSLFLVYRAATEAAVVVAVRAAALEPIASSAALETTDGGCR
jgi:hypothetical protein